MNLKFNKLLSFALGIAFAFSLAGPAFAQGNTGGDIAGHWAEASIREWADLGLLTGDGNGNYYPDKIIPRAQFMALVNRAMGYSQMSDSIKGYTDVSKNKWYYSDVAKALSAGYITGTSIGKMSPDQPISKQQAAMIIANIAKLNTASADTGVLKNFTDASAISAWAKKPLACVISNGLFTGSGGKLNASSSLTRAEAVTLLDRVRTNSRIFSVPGTFGPETGTSTVSNVVIAASGVTLQNYNVTGNLTITKAVGSGEATLSGVTVAGNILVNGGGENSVYFNDVTVSGTVSVDRDDNGTVRIVVSGGSNISAVVLESGAILMTKELTGGGIEQVTIPPESAAGGAIKLIGKFNAVTNNYAGAKIVLSDAQVGTLNLNRKAAITGNGKITTANVATEAGSGTTMEIKPGSISGAGANAVTISASGTIGGGSGFSGGSSGGGPVASVGTVTGTVTSGGIPVKGASISLSVSGTTYSATTGSAGTYSIANVPFGTDYSVTASKFGYTNAAATASVTAGGTTSGVNLSMSELPATFSKVTAYDSSARTLQMSGISEAISFDKIDGWEAVSLGDYINYTGSGPAYQIKKATLVSGNVSATAGPSHKITAAFIGETRYSTSGCTNASALPTFSTYDIMPKYNCAVYLDPFDCIVAIDADSVSVSSSGDYVLTSASENSGIYTVTTSYFSSRPFTLSTGNALNSSAFDACNNPSGSDKPVLVNAVIDNDVMTVTAIGNSFDDAITTGTAQVGTFDGNAVNADANTTFLFYSNGSYQIYTGIDKVPTATAYATDAYYLANASGVASYVLVIEDTSIPTGYSYVYQAQGNEIIDGVTAYRYSVITSGGEFTTINSRTELTAGFYSYVLYSDGISECTPASNDNCLSGTVSSYVSGTLATENGSCSILSTTHVYVKNGVVYEQSDDSILSTGDVVSLYVVDGNATIAVVTVNNE